MRKIKQTKHKYHGTKIYKLWGSIVKRCENESSTNYKYYGGRGIKICKEWREKPLSFIQWALTNGYDDGLEIDRINNDGDYEPNNCQFITHKENCSKNKRRIRKNNKSGARNIVLTRFGTYEVYAHIDGKQRYVKTVKTMEDAIKLRDRSEHIAEVIGNIHDKAGEQDDS